MVCRGKERGFVTSMAVIKNGHVFKTILGPLDPRVAVKVKITILCVKVGKFYTHKLFMPFLCTQGSILEPILFTIFLQPVKKSWNTAT